MKKYILCTIVLAFSLLGCAQNKLSFNGSFEQLDAKGNAMGWTYDFTKEQQKSYEIKIDSLVKQDGKYSLSLAKIADGAAFGVATFIIPRTYKGKEIQLKGYIKTDNVTKGYAGFWLRIDGTEQNVLSFDNMYKNGVTGTTNWKEYTITLPYDDAKAFKIFAGALLVGSGKMWMDNLRLYIDGKPINQAEIKPIALSKAQTDTAFLKHSGIDTVMITPGQIENLRLLAQIWGFIKYHHPAVAKGDFNMDAELFRVMPSVLKATNNIELSSTLEQWVDKFGHIDSCKNCKPADKTDAFQQPDYGSVFDKSIFKESLVNKLKFILNNQNILNNCYIQFYPGVGNPEFTHELPYSSFFYPDAGYRLLSLFRYWNMIQYFYPNRHLIGRNWNDVLTEFIPQFIKAANKTDYAVDALGVISRINDTHANIYGNAVLEAWKGMYRLPFQAKFIEGKLVVTGYYADILQIKEKFKLGDIITAINGVSVDALVKKFLPLTPASNYSAQLRDMPGTYLLRSNNAQFILRISRNGQPATVNFNGIETTKADFCSLDWNSGKDKPGYYLINNQIGYVFPGRYKNDDLPAIEKLFANTKGIIVDMRCYPSEFMPFTFVPYIKTGNADFVKFTTTSTDHPGLFKIGNPLNSTGTGQYKGKIVVIVNSITQSQAEYTTMAFQSSPNVTVIGSTTAGADGNVSIITLPGSISSYISGIGVLYPDGTESQRKGVKIDIIVNPTISGIKAGKDELLEKAQGIINGK